MAKTRIALFIVSIVVLSGCIYLAVSQEHRRAKQSKAQRPNIIVIVADDLGWNDVSFHGANQIPTPNIDALAYNGIILQRHYVLPICTPSRTAFLTGRYPIRTGMQGYPLKAGEPRAIPLNDTLLPEYLQKLGYNTHLVGKWHVGYYTDHHTPAYRGFDTFFGYYSGYITYFNHTITQDNHTGYDLHYDIAGKLSVDHNHEYMTDLITERAENIISTHDRKNPLYLQLSHVAVHSSDSKDVMEVRDANEVNRTLGYIEDFDRRKFAGVMTALDESVGRVVKALKEAEMLENSIIVFMSDNGAQTVGFLENFGSNYPLRGLKFTLFEGGVRGAACVYSPLIKTASRISNDLMHVTDWLPTFYSAAGGNLEDLEGNLDGVDQWSTLVSKKQTKRSSVMLNIDEVEKTSAAIIGKYKLINGASPQYNDYYGDSGTDKSYPEYNVSSVLTSLAGSAIDKISKSTLKVKDVVELREKARVTCENVTKYPKCFDRCLFNVYKDPCESIDLSLTHPKVVIELNNYIGKYMKVLVHQTNKPVDPASFPEHFNGTWMPWIKLPDNDNPLDLVSHVSLQVNEDFIGH
ncbi:arylsulfatase B isoform X2 [Nomia melanderi]|uniref:arylsulfatase B isoform X2 n=1 Tax=Nomia melanderi TaxID=2448451 RepID=UPI0013045FDE|nr:arylsulfatase B-like isoform X2 [Nomia melanderi]